MKRLRQAAILDLISREAITSQELLRRRLRARGFEATQATISRDIKELGLVKRAADGAYQPPGGEGPRPLDPVGAARRAVVEYLRHLERVEQFLVLKTGAGEAQALARALDQADLPEVAGTVAGDDTILVIARDTRRAQALERRFEEWVPGLRGLQRFARR